MVNIDLNKLVDRSDNLDSKLSMDQLDSISIGMDLVDHEDNIESELKVLAGVIETYEQLSETEDEYLKVETAYNLPIATVAKGDRKLNAKKLANVSVDVLIFKMWNIIGQKVNILTMNIEELLKTATYQSNMNSKKIDKLLREIETKRSLSYKDMSIPDKQSACRNMGIFCVDSEILDGNAFGTASEVIKEMKSLPALVSSFYSDLVVAEANYSLVKEGAVNHIDDLVTAWYGKSKKFPKVFTKISEDVNKKVYGAKSAIRWFSVKGHISLTNNPKKNFEAIKFERQIPYMVSKKTIRTMVFGNKRVGTGTEKVFLLDATINPNKIKSNAISVGTVDLDTMKKTLTLMKKVPFRILNKEILKTLTLVKKSTPTKNLDIDAPDKLTVTQRKDIDTEIRFLMNKRITVLKMIKNLISDQPAMMAGVLDTVRIYLANYKK